MGTTDQGVPGGPGAPWWVVLPSEHSSGTFLSHTVSSGPEKIHKNFGYVWTPFGINFMRCTKNQKTTTGTGHYINRLVPKNDIK